MADRVSLPLLGAGVGFVIGFLFVSPFRCTVTESAQVDGRGGVTTVTSADTSCSNLLGFEYAGGRNYDPPQLPALGAGLVMALLTGALAYLRVRSRERQVRFSTLGWIGVGMHIAWTLFLASLGLFSDGALDPQWRTALIFVVLAGSPVAVAIFGLRGRPALILTAGIMCLPLSFISLAGATLPLLIPGVLYLIAYARS